MGLNMNDDDCGLGLNIKDDCGLGVKKNKADGCLVVDEKRS